jgi:hypothetical protein
MKCLRTTLVLFISVALLVSACNGSLSEEQRRKMREEMELHKIRKITEAEITDAAYIKGRALMDALANAQNNPQKIDSLATASQTRIRWIVPGKTTAEGVEQQLIESYIAGAESGSLQDNIQKIRSAEGEADSLLFTRPIVKNLPDGVVKVEGTWNITMSQKQVILGMTPAEK